jgi:thioredoxin reductase (NADPH)
VTSNGDHYEARAVLVATGSTYRRTGAEGEDDLIGAGVHFCATCDGPFYKGAEELLVLGGGNSGLEEGLFLAQFADSVTIVEYKDRLAGSQVLQDKIASDPKMNVLLQRKVTAFRPKDDGSGKIGTVVLEHTETGEVEERHPAAVFVFIGLDPNTGFLTGTVDLDPWGFVVTDDALMTSMPGVFAAGDVRVGSTKQLASAVGEGAAVALQIRRFLERQLEEAVHPGD